MHRWRGYPLVLSGGCTSWSCQGNPLVLSGCPLRQAQRGPAQIGLGQVVSPLLWTDKQTENFTFPHTTYVDDSNDWGETMQTTLLKGFAIRMRSQNKDITTYWKLVVLRCVGCISNQWNKISQKDANSAIFSRVDQCIMMLITTGWTALRVFQLKCHLSFSGYREWSNSWRTWSYVARFYAWWSRR